MVVPPNPFALAADLFDPPVDPYATDPVAFAADRLGFIAWSKQREILESVRDNLRTTVRACHGPGKTAVAAQVVLWFLAAHPGTSRVVTTAPTWAQVVDLLWREIRAGVTRAHGLGHLTTWPAPFQTKLELGEQWFAIGHSTDRPERFQGHHAEHLLLIVDEASGVDERIYEAAEGFLTAEGARVLLLGNPTRIGGAFHRSFTSEAADWHVIHISAFDCPNETGEPVPDHVARALPRKGWADERKRAWGENSAIYQVRVLGNPPRKGTANVIDLDVVEDAQRRQLEPTRPADRDDVVVACDVARFGDDETVIGTRHQGRVRIRKTYLGKPITETAGHVIDVWRQLRQESGANPRIVIDDDGVGGGLTDILRAKGYDVTAFNGGARALDPAKYPNRRSEAWFRVGRRLPDLDLDPDDQLLADLVTPTWKMDSDGRRRVEKKEETKKRLGRSPDRGDMVLLLLVPTLTVTVPDDTTIATAGVDEYGPLDAPPPVGSSLTSDLLDGTM